MIDKIDFFFEVSKEAKIATDGKGGYSECYLKLGFTLKNPMEESEAEEVRNQMADDALNGAANFLKVDKSLITIISEEEYLQYSEDSSDDFDKSCFAEYDDD